MENTNDINFKDYEIQTEDSVASFLMLLLKNTAKDYFVRVVKDGIEHYYRVISIISNANYFNFSAEYINEEGLLRRISLIKLGNIIDKLYYKLEDDSEEYSPVIIEPFNHDIKRYNLDEELSRYLMKSCKLESDLKYARIIRNSLKPINYEKEYTKEKNSSTPLDSEKKVVQCVSYSLLDKNGETINIEHSSEISNVSTYEEIDEIFKRLNRERNYARFCVRALTYIFEHMNLLPLTNLQRVPRSRKYFYEDYNLVYEDICYVLRKTYWKENINI